MRFPGQVIYTWFRQGIRNPATRQWVILGVLIYLLSPIDLIPSILPGIGEIDDVLLLGLLFSELGQVWWSERGKPIAPKPDPSVETTPNRQVIDVVAVEE